MAQGMHWVHTGRLKIESVINDRLKFNGILYKRVGLKITDVSELFTGKIWCLNWSLHNRISAPSTSNLPQEGFKSRTLLHYHFSFFNFLFPKVKIRLLKYAFGGELIKIWVLIMYHKELDIWQLHFSHLGGNFYGNILKCQISCGT